MHYLSFCKLISRKCYDHSHVNYIYYIQISVLIYRLNYIPCHSLNCLVNLWTILSTLWTVWSTFETSCPPFELSGQPLNHLVHPLNCLVNLWTILSTFWTFWSTFESVWPPGKFITYHLSQICYNRQHKAFFTGNWKLEIQSFHLYWYI
jgi:hypothetical protein